MNLVELLDFLIRHPDGGQAGGLRGHHVNADTEISAQGRNAGTHELHYLVFHIAVFEDRADDGQRHVLRAHALHRFAGKINTYHAGHFNVIGLVQKLLYQLRSALSHGHGSQSAVTGMGIGAQNHLSAARKHFPCELVDDRLMRRHIDAAVFLRAGQAEHMVILVDGAAHRAQGIVAVGEHIGDREPGQP